MGKVLSVIEAVDVLRQGQIVGLPTETVYGLGADATNEAAVAKLYKAKNRPSFDPLIVHVPTLAAVKEIAELSNAAEQLFLAFSPGPLTVVLPKKKTIPDLVTSGHPTVAVRIPAHPLMLDVLQSSGLCIAAPSANPFGFASPTTAQHVLDQLGTKISGVVDGGPCSIGIESTIVDMSSNTPKVLRLGGMALEQLERVLGPITAELSSSNPSAPGMLSSHYNPGTSVQLFDDREALLAALKSNDNPNGIGILYWGETITHSSSFNLSEQKSDSEAACNLFKGLRLLGKAPLTTIYVHLLPEYGLGRAVNDRLQRAANK
ncbi:MAG: L-threonylcarbamoyladenylate synthase [Schleiferiaceae bacterium]|jgi:L-threonylcarbamoyladenylate synthase|nr:L-threonylcarbamoyladenylate synthase [Schleiferiaceae bacterium]MDG1903812.1 L-threonylcarbamoyladenylate synthase [Schleiferiaceae bacterium]